MKKFKQAKHFRTSKTGKVFRAGQGDERGRLLREGLPHSHWKWPRKPDSPGQMRMFTKGTTPQGPKQKLAGLRYQWDKKVPDVAAKLKMLGDKARAARKDRRLSVQAMKGYKDIRSALVRERKIYMGGLRMYFRKELRRG